MLSVKTYFAGAFTKFLDNEVLLDESGVRFKYSDIQTFSSSKFFQALDRKLIICKLTNDAECLALYFALLASGAIPLLTSADIAESEYLELLKPKFLHLLSGDERNFFILSKSLKPAQGA